MAKISLKTYCLSILILLCIYFLLTDSVVGIIYIFFTIVSIVTLNLFKSNFYRSAYFILILSVMAGYFLRPLILVNHPELFMYSKIASRTNIETIHKSLYFSLTNFVLISAAFVLTVKFTPDKISVERQNDFLLKHFNIIMLIIFAINLLKFILIAFENTGLRNDVNRDTTYGFVLKLLSPELTFYVCYIYIAKYWRKISVRKRTLIFFIILMTSASVLLTGSKVFLALFGLCIFLNILYNNKKIKTWLAISLTAAGLPILVFSFAVAFAVKFSDTRNTASILAKAQSYTNSRDYLALGDAITQRLAGLDGQIAIYTLQQQANKRINYVLQKSFSLKELMLHIFENIVPRVKLSDTPNTGKAISENIVGLPSEASHGGALGLFAAIMFTCGNYFFLFDIILGILLGLYFVYVRRIKSNDLRFILFAIGSYFIIRLVLSGNFDVIISEFGLEWLMLFCYIKFLQLAKL